MEEIVEIRTKDGEIIAPPYFKDKFKIGKTYTVKTVQTVDEGVSLNRAQRRRCKRREVNE